MSLTRSYVPSSAPNSVGEFTARRRCSASLYSFIRRGIAAPRHAVRLDAKNSLHVLYDNASTGADLGLAGVEFPGDLRINSAGELLLGDQETNTIQRQKSRSADRHAY